MSLKFHVTTVKAIQVTQIFWKNCSYYILCWYNTSTI